MLVFDLYAKCKKERKYSKNLDITYFRNKLLKEENWNLRTEPNKRWDQKANCWKRVAKDVLGESKGIIYTNKENSLWNNEGQEAIDFF